MRESDFTENRTGRLVKIPERVFAFVPDPLPPKNLLPNWELSRLNSEADRALSELAGLARILPNANLLSGTFRRREAVLSSRIEGTFTTLSELFLFEASGGVEDNTADVREVWNYVNALDYGLKRIKELPICNRLIQDLHRVLMSNVRGGDKTPGEFRTHQNYIGASARTPIQNASYVPPPKNEMLQAMNALEEFINGHCDFPPLIREALIHYQFEAIHPFQDGNGRVGRLLLTLDLCAEGIVEHPLLYLSEYIERHKEEYYALLYAVSTEGAWQSWVEFFLRAVSHQARVAQECAKQLHALMQEQRQRLTSTKAPSYTFDVLEELFFVPVISSSQITRIVGGRIETGQRAIEKLQAAGIIQELKTGRRRNKMYVAGEINRIVIDPTSSNKTLAAFGSVDSP